MGLQFGGPTGWIAFLWQEGSLLDLGTLGGQSAARAINNRGQVAGLSDIGSGNYHAFLWTAAAGMTDLGTLGGSSSEAVAINDRGQVVGSSETASGDTHAFIWTEAEGMRDLNGLIEAGGWTLEEARGVNKKGQIIAQAVDGGATPHAVLLTPRP